jgi:hypothetical protein
MRTASSKNTARPPALAKNQPLAKLSHLLRSVGSTYNRLESWLNNLSSVNLPVNASLQAVLLPQSLV